MLLTALLLIAAAAACAGEPATVTGIREQPLSDDVQGRLDKLGAEYGEQLFADKSNGDVLSVLLEVATAANLTTDLSARMIRRQVRQGFRRAESYIDTWSKALLKHNLRTQNLREHSRADQRQAVADAKVNLCFVFAMHSWATRGCLKLTDRL
jgi:hypothetical protein